MGATSAIEWTDATWNPWYGCLKVSPGCKQCYMYRDQERFGRDPRAVTRAKDATFYAPLKWKEPVKIFTCSWSDFFIEEADEWREEAWNVIRTTPRHTYQILTKRPENIADRLPLDWGEGYPNVWLGVSVETQQYLHRYIYLCDWPYVTSFISYEPALGPLDLTEIKRQGYMKPDWVISGGESGSKPRLANPEWFRSVRDQCAELGIAYFHKQNGGSRKIDGAWGGREIDGEIYHKFPELLEVER